LIEPDVPMVHMETFDWTSQNQMLKTMQTQGTDDILLETGPVFPGDETAPKQRKRNKQVAVPPFQSLLEPEGPNDRHKTEAEQLSALWTRPEARDVIFSLKADKDEHPCFAGYRSMIEDTNRCKGFERQYPPVGSNVQFFNLAKQTKRNSTLGAVLGDLINVWFEDSVSEQHITDTIKAAAIITNYYDIPELRTPDGSRSWLEHECSTLGSMPFQYTCSNRINVMVQQCGIENAWVMTGDYLQNFPNPAHEKSVSNHDILFYLCHEFVTSQGNPYAGAVIFAHELAHVIQGGFGFSYTVMTEGSATWLEGALLGLSPRPLLMYAYRFKSWDDVMSAHFYANYIGTGYQIHSMFLTYLAQESLLGVSRTAAMTMYRVYESRHVPWGRGVYDYYLQFLGKETPDKLSIVDMDTTTTEFPLANVLLNFWVAMAAQCIGDPNFWPTEAEYLMPPKQRTQPYWDCTSFRTWWACGPSGGSKRCDPYPDNAFREMHYGGAAIFRIAYPDDLTISMASEGDPFVRTKVLVVGSASTGQKTEVRELRLGENATFKGDGREAFIVQVNVDPKGELVSAFDFPPLWHRASSRCKLPCRGQAWTTDSFKGVAANKLRSLRSPLVTLPAGKNASLTFDAMWDLEASTIDGTTVGKGCPTKGHGGVQVRVIVDPTNVQRRPVNGASHGDDDTIVVLKPQGGYGTGPNGESALHAFSVFGVYRDKDCSGYEGWTGSSGPNYDWTQQAFDLSSYAGKNVSLEVLFASEHVRSSAKGFWLDNFQVASEGLVLFNEDAEAAETLMFEHPFVIAPIAGDVGLMDGVPVTVQVPSQYQADKGLEKGNMVRQAPWSARWRDPSEASSGAKAAKPTMFANSAMKGTDASQGGGSTTQATGGASSEGASKTVDGSAGKPAFATGDGNSESQAKDHDQKWDMPINVPQVPGLSPLTQFSTVAPPYAAAEPGTAASRTVPLSSLKRAYLGWSYNVPGFYSQSLRLHPWQEACIMQTAPFDGRIETVQLFTFVDKVGVSATSLGLRSPEEPHEPMGQVVRSESPGVEDLGMHKFHVAHAFPKLAEKEQFLLCVGVEGRPLLASDPTDHEPYLHMPLTKVPATHKSATTMLLAISDSGTIKKGAKVYPWMDWTLVARSEFSQIPPNSAPNAASVQFAAPQAAADVAAAAPGAAVAPVVGPQAAADAAAAAVVAPVAQEKSHAAGDLRSFPWLRHALVAANAMMFAIIVPCFA
jgi:hypothetical protein